MERVPPSVRLAQLAAFVGVMYFAIQLAIHLGIEKKTWWQFSWEIITGGTLGAIAGVAFFVLVGAVGLVSGAMFGALGLLGPRLIGVHAVHLEDSEIAELARFGVTVAHCPSSNLKLASGIARVSDLVSAGVNVALGTDGISSNDSCRLFDVMKVAGILHTLETDDYDEWPSAAEISTQAQMPSTPPISSVRALMRAAIQPLASDGRYMPSRCVEITREVSPLE